MLLITVLNREAVAQDGFDFLLGLVDIHARLHPQLQRRELSLPIEKPSGKGDACEDVFAVVAALFHLEDHAGGEYGVFRESLCGVAHVVLSLPLWRIDVEIVGPIGAGAEVFGNPDARHGVVEVGLGETKLAVTVEDVANVGERVEVGLHTLHRQRLILYAFCGHGNKG